MAAIHDVTRQTIALEHSDGDGDGTARVSKELIRDMRRRLEGDRALRRSLDR